MKTAILILSLIFPDSSAQTFRFDFSSEDKCSSAAMEVEQTWERLDNGVRVEWDCLIEISPQANTKAPSHAG